MFDRRVTDYGYLNTYSFTKDGQKTTLSPLAPYQLLKYKPSKTYDQTEMLLMLVEPTLQALQHEFRPFKDWVIQFNFDPEET